MKTISTEYWGLWGATKQVWASRWAMDGSGFPLVSPCKELIIYLANLWDPNHTGEWEVKLVGIVKSTID